MGAVKRNIELLTCLDQIAVLSMDQEELNIIIQQQDDYIEQLENNWLVLCGKKLGLFRRKGFS